MDSDQTKMCEWIQGGGAMKYYRMSSVISFVLKLKGGGGNPRD